jgi:hypothetical protein
MALRPEMETTMSKTNETDTAIEMNEASRELTAVELEDVSGGGKTIGGHAKIIDGRFQVMPHL